MHSIRHSLFAAGGVLVLLAVLSVVPPRTSYSQVPRGSQPVDVNVVNTPAVTVERNLVYDGQSFDLLPNPNIAFELAVPPGVVLTDVALTLNAPSLSTTFFVSDFTKMLVLHGVGSAGSTFAANTDGRAALHFQSGLHSQSGFRIGVTCNNIGGNACAGAIMWSGYQP